MKKNIESDINLGIMSVVCFVMLCFFTFELPYDLQHGKIIEDIAIILILNIPIGILVFSNEKLSKMGKIFLMIAILWVVPVGPVVQYFLNDSNVFTWLGVSLFFLIGMLVANQS